VKIPVPSAKSALGAGHPQLCKINKIAHLCRKHFRNSQVRIVADYPSLSSLKKWR